MFTLPKRELLGGNIRYLFIIEEVVMGAVGIRQDEGMFVGVVLEVVVDPFLFHQPADEIKIRLAVLYAIFSGLVRFI